MTHTEHTPGPWLLNEEYSPLCARDQDDRIIADCSGTGRPREEAKANALLVHAAPDLLAALEGLMNSISFKEYCAFSLRAEAAIAKARGDQPSPEPIPFPAPTDRKQAA